jgi:lysophospholipase L1-like esterase
VLWRLDHDELPPELDAKVYWIVVGGNDLSRGQCSEEVVVLGLLRLAEELKQRRPDSIVVINSILPRLPPPSKNKHKWKHAKQAPLLDVWPSIQIVNHVLDKYCRNHPEIQFFDSTALFFGGDNKRKVDDSLFQSTLMLEDRVHLSRKGYKVWGQAVADKVKEIVHEEDTS